MKAKLNIQAIRVAERLLKKPFGRFDLSSDEDLTALMYGMVSENNDEVFVLDKFRLILKQRKTRASILSMVSDELSYIGQFSENKEGESDSYIGELAAVLITSGVDARFVLYEMKLFEIGDYLKAIEEKKKEKMESERLWTYLTILPHVDGKKLKSPQDLIRFPWEEEKPKVSERDIEIALKFINSKPLQSWPEN